MSTIQAWNDMHSADRQIVLLPLRWETHSAPEYGTRPQEVINRQVVDHCDLLVGIFWTRIGSPTGVADSGTLEEIERVATHGKPVMLYFSRSRQDPDAIDVDQLSKLREFKKKTFPAGLIETYATQIEFRDKLQKQLEIQLRTLITAENQVGSSEQSSPTTDVLFEFADVRKGTRDGAKAVLNTTYFEVPDIDDLPDYRPAEEATDDTDLTTLSYLNPINRDYYRQLAYRLVQQNYFAPVRFWLRNAGSLGARDVYVDLRISTKKEPVRLDVFRELELPQPRGTSYAMYRALSANIGEKPEQVGTSWTTKLELPALQPKRDISPGPQFVVGANKKTSIEVVARIYADTLPEPITKTLEIELVVAVEHKSARALLHEAGVSLPNHMSAEPADRPGRRTSKGEAKDN